MVAITTLKRQTKEFPPTNSQHLKIQNFMQKVTHILEEKMSCRSDFLPHKKMVLWTELDLWYDQTRMEKKIVISM